MKPDDLWLAEDGNVTLVRSRSRAARFVGEEAGVEVTLRISGPGVAAFETPYRGSDGAIERLGRSFSVIVDPADGAYMIVC